DFHVTGFRRVLFRSRGRGGGAANFLGGSDRRWDKAVFGVAVAELAIFAIPPAVGGAGGGEPAAVGPPGGYGRESEAAGYRCRYETVVGVAAARPAELRAATAGGLAGGGEPAGESRVGGAGREGEDAGDRARAEAV